jgi:competence protein ComEA
MHVPDSGLVDVNSASLIQLLRLPGIDGTLAGRIITVRERSGRFSSLEELGAVLALDATVVEGLRDWVEFPAP